MPQPIQSLDDARKIAELLSDPNAGLTPEQEQQLYAALQEYDKGRRQWEAQQDLGTPYGETKRKLGAVVEGAVAGLGDSVDFAIAPLTAGIFHAGKAMGWIDDDENYLGDDGFMDLSGFLKEKVDLIDDSTLTDAERRIMGFSRALGGAVTPMLLGKTLVATGVKKAGSYLLHQKGMQFASAFAGEGGAQLAEELVPNSTTAMVAGSLLGAFSPTMARAALRKGLGLSTPKQIKERMDEGRDVQPDTLQTMDDSEAIDVMWRQIIKDNQNYEELKEIGLVTADTVAEPTRILAVKPTSMQAGLLGKMVGAKPQVAKANALLEQRIGAILKTEAKKATKDLDVRTQRKLKAEDVGESAAARAMGEALDLADTDFRRRSTFLFDVADYKMKEMIGDPVPTFGAPSPTQFVAKNLAATVEEVYAGSLQGSVTRNILKEMNEATGYMLLPAQGSRHQPNPRSRAVFLSYDQMVAARKVVTKRLSRDVPVEERRQVRRLYNAIFEDTWEAAKLSEEMNGLKVPTPYKDFREAHEHFLKGVTQQEQFVRRFEQALGKSPNAFFDDIIDTSARDPAAITGLIKYMDDHGDYGRAAIRAGLLERLGAPGGGKAFSLDEFATRWDSLDPGAIDAIFEGAEESKKALTMLARVAARQRQQMTQSAQGASDILVGGLGAAIPTAVGMTQGLGWGAGALVGTYLTGRWGAQALTNPTFVRAMVQESQHGYTIGQWSIALSRMVSDDPTTIGFAEDMMRLLDAQARLEQAEIEQQDTEARYGINRK